MFNFGISSDSAVRNSRQQLKPWNIYDVKFMGCEVREFKGTKDPTATYKVLDIKFENEDGYFTLTNFFPKQGDEERKEFPSSNGGKTIMASNFETLMAVVKQTAQILNPSGFEKMQAASAKFKSFDDVANALIKITDGVKGKETKLKLVGKNQNGKVVANIPRIVRINSTTGEAYIADNYIGDKLFFSDYEEGQRAKYMSAKPTTMPSENFGLETPATPSENSNIEVPVAPAENSGDDFNLDDLL